MQNNQCTEKELKLAEYKIFLDSLDLNLDIIDVLGRSEYCLDGWTSIESIVCKSDEKSIYDVDIRFAWSSQIFNQYLYDHAWDESTLLDNFNHKLRYKLVIYLCSPTTLIDSTHISLVPDEFIIGNYWKEICHYYIPLLPVHPFDIPDLPDNKIDSSCSLPAIISQDKSITRGGLRTRGVHKTDIICQPLISVITVVFNGEKKIEQTIQSVINQNYENIEYIIIDGGSNDRTTDIIDKYSDRIDFWKSEKDLGIYDAMNKGIALATGKWLNFMNCGDIFYSHQSLSQVPLNNEVDFYYSDTILHDSSGNTKLRICSQEQKDVIHQSIVYKKELHSTYQYLVHDNLTISDYFFFRRNDSKNWFKLSQPLAIYNTEGVSGNGSKGFTQKLFVKFMSGDISEFKMSLLIIGKILRSPLRKIRNILIDVSILKSSTRY
jgi:Glycosyl transferase family 2